MNVKFRIAACGVHARVPMLPEYLQAVCILRLRAPGSRKEPEELLVGEGLAFRHGASPLDAPSWLSGMLGAAGCVVGLGRVRWAADAPCG